MRIRFPANNRWMKCELHLLPFYLPFLLSLKEIDRLGIYIDKLSKRQYTSTGYCAPVTRRWGHAFIVRPKLQVGLFTEQELRNMHHHFWNPNVGKLTNVHKRATGKTTKTKTYRLIEKIKRHCDYCQHYGDKPQSLKFKLRDESISSSHNIYCNVLTVEKKQVLQVVNESSIFQAAHCLTNISTYELCMALERYWINVYLGHPDTITYDAGSNFIVRAFQPNGSGQQHVS